MPTRREIALLGVCALLAFTAMSNLAATLAGMHLPATAAGTVVSVASPFTSHDKAQDIVRSWADWDNVRAFSNSSVAPPGTVAAGWLLLDSIVLAPLLAVILSKLARRRAVLTKGRQYPLRQAVEAGTPLAVLYLASDELENLVTAFFIYDSPNKVLSYALRAGSGGKLLFFVLAAGGIGASFRPGFSATQGRTGPESVGASDAEVRVQPPAVPLGDAVGIDASDEVRAGATAPGALGDNAGVLATLRILRVPAVVVAVAATVLTQLPASVRDQVADVVRTWVWGDRLWTAVTAFLALALFTTEVGLAGAAVLIRSREAVSTNPSQTGRWLRYAVVGTLVFVVGWKGPTWGPSPAAQVVGIGLVAFALLSCLANLCGDNSETNARPGIVANPTVLAALVATPAVAFAVLILRSVDLTGAWEPKAQGLVLAALALGLAAAAWRATGPAMARADPTDLPQLFALLGVCVLPAVAVAGSAAWNPHSTGWAVGSLALVFLAATVMLGLLALFEHLLWSPPSGLYAALNLRRAPLALTVLGVFVIGSMTDDTVAFHRARRLTAEQQQSQPAIDFDAVKLRQRYGRVVRTDKGEYVPLFVIATSGGGARAAYWTLRVLNCLFGGQSPGAPLAPCDQNPVPWDSALLASGISGGSVALAMFASQRADGPFHVDVEDVFARGFLDPVMASLLFVDLPVSLLRVEGPGDRAAALEEAWEARLEEMGTGLFNTQVVSGATAIQNEPRLPVLLLNSASVEDGCRINVSVLNLAGSPLAALRGGETGPLDPSCRGQLAAESASYDLPPGPLAGSRDVSRFVCEGGDIRLSTAALLSARFPLVSPTGGLTACDKLRGKDVHTFAVDGGYVDSSAASTLVEIVSAIQRTGGPCIQPVVLQIDNGYADLTQPTAPDRPGELIAPLAGYGAVSGSRADAARDALARLANSRCAAAPAGLPSYLHVYPTAHPGSTAPLGWSLSEVARADLDNELGRYPNQCALLAVKAWLLPPGATRSCKVVTVGDPNHPSARLPFDEIDLPAHPGYSCQPSAQRQPLNHPVPVCRSDAAGVVHLLSDAPAPWATVPGVPAQFGVSLEEDPGLRGFGFPLTLVLALVSCVLIAALWLWSGDE